MNCNYEEMRGLYCQQFFITFITFLIFMKINHYLLKVHCVELLARISNKSMRFILFILFEDNQVLSFLIFIIIISEPEIVCFCFLLQKLNQLSPIFLDKEKIRVSFPITISKFAKFIILTEKAKIKERFKYSHIFTQGESFILKYLIEVLMIDISNESFISQKVIIPQVYHMFLKIFRTFLAFFKQVLLLLLKTFIPFRFKISLCHWFVLMITIPNFSNTSHFFEKWRVSPFFEVLLKCSKISIFFILLEPFQFFIAYIRKYITKDSQLWLVVADIEIKGTTRYAAVVESHDSYISHCSLFIAAASVSHSLIQCQQILKCDELIWYIGDKIYELI